MKLYRESFYNPFFIDVNGKKYEINKIHFFDESGVICSTSCGWFGANNYFRNGLEIDVECFIKRKADFTANFAFLLPSESREKSWYSNLLLHEIYIPSAAVGLKQPTAKKPYPKARYYIVLWKSDIDGVTVDKWEWIDKKLRPIEERIKEIGESISKLYVDFSHLPEMLKELQKLEKQRQKALLEMEQITPESVLTKYKRKEGAEI